MKLTALTNLLDQYLDISSFADAAVNGLQVQNSGSVTKIGLAVDACLETILLATQENCNLLLVHHGIFWGSAPPICGHHYRRVQALILADMSLYAAHLPLDAHPEVGNNIQIAKQLGLNNVVPFGSLGGPPLGVQGCLPTPRSWEAALGECRRVVGQEKATLRFGPELISRVGIITGSATDPHLFEEANRAELDLFITGEPKQPAYSLAQELNLNIFYGGHYQTEKTGVMALGEYLEKQLGLPTVFLETGCPF